MKSSMKSSMKVSIKSDKSILLREIYRLKRELVAESHRADSNLEMWEQGNARLQKAEVSIVRLMDLVPDLLLPVARTIVKGAVVELLPDAERDCTIEGMGCGHVPGDDECNGCGNWQLVEHDELV